MIEGEPTGLGDLVKFAACVQCGVARFGEGGWKPKTDLCGHCEGQRQHTLFPEQAA